MFAMLFGLVVPVFAKEVTVNLNESCFPDFPLPKTRIVAVVTLHPIKPSRDPINRTFPEASNSFNIPDDTTQLNFRVERTMRGEGWKVEYTIDGATIDASNWNQFNNDIPATINLSCKKER